jgi:hypothetical protein
MSTLFEELSRVRTYDYTEDDVREFEVLHEEIRALKKARKDGKLTANDLDRIAVSRHQYRVQYEMGSREGKELRRVGSFRWKKFLNLRRPMESYEAIIAGAERALE